MKKFFLSGLATAMLTLSTGVMAANFVECRRSEQKEYKQLYRQ